MKALSFDNYPVRIFVADRQLSVEYIEITHRYQNKHRETLGKLALTITQKKFFTTLLETPGVLRIVVRVNELQIWKCPGYEWSDIEQNITNVIDTCLISDHDLTQQTKRIVGDSKQMTLLYTAPYFKKYLRLSMVIFGIQYTIPSYYKQHPWWIDFIDLLRDAGVPKILITQGRMIGSMANEYTCFPITPNSTPEEKIRKSYLIVEEIFL